MLHQRAPKLVVDRRSGVHLSKVWENNIIEFELHIDNTRKRTH